MRRIVIFANGSYQDLSYYRSLILSTDYILCADGGANRAISMDIIPHEVIGDLDSITVETHKKLLALRVAIQKFPAEKDYSDLELTMQRAAELQPSEILILGALGNRLDQTLHNLNLLLTAARHSIPAYIVDENHHIQLVTKKAVILGEFDEYLSLTPLSPKVTNVRTEGLKYPLLGETLFYGSTRGLSNEFTEKKAIVTLKDGYLLAIRVKKCL